jgi:hypothetical protein
MKSATAKFDMGLVYATNGALAAFEKTDESSLVYLMRHVSGDWGDVSEDDRRSNAFALDNGLRLFSAFHLADGTKLWVITEADRSMTTMLLPSEY